MKYLVIVADGYFPDRQNCRIYHICSSGVDTAAVCGDGTSWDPVKNNCNWENSVQCKKGLRKWDEITDIRGGKYKLRLGLTRIDRLKFSNFICYRCSIGMASKEIDNNLSNY